MIGTVLFLALLEYWNLELALAWILESLHKHWQANWDAPQAMNIGAVRARALRGVG